MARGETEKALSLADKLAFNAGGYLNHEFFFDGLCAPKDSARPDEGTTLRTMIENSFGSWEEFEKSFVTETAAIKGSGWGWLVYNTKYNYLFFRSTAN